jgi:hypothetical protein
VGLASRRVAGPLGLLALGPLLSELVISPPRRDRAHSLDDISTGLTWLFIAGCAVAVCVAGYGMGYRRGVKDAINGGTRKSDRRLDGD